MSQRCQQETHAPQQFKNLFDHLVGACEHSLRDIKAKGLGRLHVDDQLELDRGLHGNFARLFALENAIRPDFFRPAHSYALQCLREANAIIRE